MKSYGSTILTITALSLSTRTDGLTFTSPRLSTTPSLLSNEIIRHQRRHALTRLSVVRTPVEGFPAAATSVRFFNETTTTATTIVEEGLEIPRCIESKVLKRVYPAILAHIEEYGNANIPLGSKEGKYCKTLRRLAFQQNLSTDEIDLLTNLGFRWNNFEDVYEEADFDDCLDRLVRYEAEVKSNYQIPKKYKPDPELGAWVTVIRRIGRENIEPQRMEQLDAIKFAWKSTRKCGSSFMGTYRPLKERLESCCKNVAPSSHVENDGVEADDLWELVDRKGMEDILQEETIGAWLMVQKKKHAAGDLSESRCTYMDQLPGFDWHRWGDGA